MNNPNSIFWEDWRSSPSSSNSSNAFPFFSLGAAGLTSLAALAAWRVAEREKKRAAAFQGALEMSLGDAASQLAASRSASSSQYVRVKGAVGADDPVAAREDGGTATETVARAQTAATVVITKKYREYEEQYKVVKSRSKSKKSRSRKSGADKRGTNATIVDTGSDTYKWRRGSHLMSSHERMSRRLYVEGANGERIRLHLEGATSPSYAPWRSLLPKIDDVFVPSQSAASHAAGAGSRRELGYRTQIHALLMGESIIVQGLLYRDVEGEVAIKCPGGERPFLFDIAGDIRRMATQIEEQKCNARNAAVALSCTAAFAGLVFAYWVSAWLSPRQDIIPVAVAVPMYVKNTE